MAVGNIGVCGRRRRLRLGWGLGLRRRRWRVANTPVELCLKLLGEQLCKLLGIGIGAL